MQPEDYKKYIALRNAIYEVVKKCEDLFESRMLTIATGALGLSFTLLPFIVPSGVYCQKWIIAAAWSLIVWSIVMNLSSHLASKVKAKRTIVRLDEMIKANKPYDYKEINEIINKKNRRTEWTDIISLVALIVGILGVCIFTVINFASK